MMTMNAREFIRDVSSAKRAASQGPVVITDRGVPAYVLLSVEEYEKLHDDGRDLVSTLSMDEDFEFKPPTSELSLDIPEL